MQHTNYTLFIMPIYANDDIKCFIKELYYNKY